MRFKAVAGARLFRRKLKKNSFRAFLSAERDAKKHGFGQNPIKIRTDQIEKSESPIPKFQSVFKI